MTTSERCLPLRQRIIASTQGLAYSTISCPEGVTAGLGNPNRDGKLDPDHSVQRLLPHANHDRPVTKSRWTRKASSASLRSLPSKAVAKDIQLEFETFCHLEAGLSHGYGDIDKAVTTGIAPAEKALSPSLEELWITDVDLHVGRATTRSSSSRQQQMKDVDLTDFQRKASTAARLRQLQGHMNTAAHCPAYEVAAGQPSGSVRTHRTILPGTSGTETDYKQMITRMIEVQHHFDDLEDQLAMDFHCPYVECARNLHSRKLQCGLAPPQRWCVHGGCLFTTADPRKWVEHSLMPHHDLQES